MPDDDPFDLARFLDAQAPAMAAVTRELSEGRKRTHWMWFVFPQLRGLGHSAMAQRYGIASRAEAEAYWRHSVLGPRLAMCTALVNRAEGATLREVLGSPDDMKFQACVTLFAAVAPEEVGFLQALSRWFGGEPHGATLALLGSPQG
ncbi:DUF1810 domain-containing protein [Falsiroseomonas sp. HW251]|uniref:DUF1810 domain-containing protein n=1 Tax=Falsiroseomonas sp. HW251 TaxID=3390998 RepID=UPI003D31B145